MQYFRLIPEVPGQLGPKTKMDTTIHPPKVEHLHFVFYGWEGDELIECFPVFLVSEKLLKRLNESNLTGLIPNDNFEISYSEEFLLLYPDREMPIFLWVMINREKGDDFFIDKDHYLQASDRALNILEKFGTLNNCEIEKAD